MSLLESLEPLIATADSELSDVEVKNAELAEIRTRLAHLRSQVDTAQAALDATSDALATEKSEAMFALRAIVTELQARIAALETTP